MHCTRCSNASAKLQLFTNIALCAPCLQALSNDQRNPAMPAVSRLSIAVLALAGLGIVCGMNPLLLAGIGIGVVVVNGTRYYEQRRFLRQFSDSETSLLPVAKIQPHRETEL
jgi:hypothetical protein